MPIPDINPSDIHIGYDDWERCEALVNSPAWTRIDDSAQCSHVGRPQPDRCGVSLCWQHKRTIEDGGALPLTGNRLLVVDWRWSEDGWRREVTETRILENIIDLERRRRDQPPVWWKPVTDEDRRFAMKVIEDLFKAPQDES